MGAPDDGPVGGSAQAQTAAGWLEDGAPRGTPRRAADRIRPRRARTCRASGRRRPEAPGGARARSRRRDRGGRSPFRASTAWAASRTTTRTSRRCAPGSPRTSRSAATVRRGAARPPARPSSTATSSRGPAATTRSINAATLSLVAGEGALAREWAERALEVVRDAPDDYYAAATVGEARLLLGDVDGARAALEHAADRHHGDYGALATTRRQLRLICELMGLDPGVLAPLAGPSVIHFCGHRLADGGFGRALRGRGRGGGRAAHRRGRAAPSDPATPTARSPAARTSCGPRRCSRRGASCTSSSRSLATSSSSARSTSSGPGWADRFDRCLKAATSVQFATNDAFLGDDVLFRYGTELAMGLALLRARYLDADVRQLAVWDGEPAAGAAGTAIDIATWRRRGGATTVITPSAEASVSEFTDPPPAAAGRCTPDSGPGRRAGRARDALRRRQGLLKAHRRAAPELLDTGSRRDRGCPRALPGRHLAHEHVGRRRLRRALRCGHGRRLCARSPGRARRRRSRRGGPPGDASPCGSAATSARCSRRTTRCSTSSGSWALTSAARRGSSPSRRRGSCT